MGDMAELIEAPLSAVELGKRYRALCDDPRFENVPGKIELDMWGRMVLTPTNNLRGVLKTRLTQPLLALGGQALCAASVSTNRGVLVADITWMSTSTWQSRRTETPLSRAPELCIEIISPSNSRKEMDQKIAAYIAAGAQEVWLVLAKSKRVRVFDAGGEQAASRFAVDLTGLFDEL
jgi:Uma2 family endonuclease